jgi:hypothetical protein
VGKVVDILPGASGPNCSFRAQKSDCKPSSDAGRKADGSAELAVWRIQKSKNLAQGKLRTQLWWHHA